MLYHFSKPHISYLTESETSVPQLTGTIQKTNQGFLTFLLLGKNPQPAEVPFFFLFFCF